jgi:1,4-alpha-glucan branching enzyme
VWPDLRIPAPDAARVEVRFASLLDRDKFDRPTWRHVPMSRLSGRQGWWTLSVAGLGVPDGDYEYEFILDGDDAAPVADPFANEIVRFDGYRGLLRIRGGGRSSLPFDWSDELPAGVRLPDNNEIVIYEMPLRWMASAGADFRQVDLGTFDDAIFQRLGDLTDLGVNAIELLPVQDSPDTLNWGYGTRFFLAPDFDVGGPVDAKLFVKRCHQHGIRVIIDVVMNHANKCPLEQLAADWFFLPDNSKEEGEDRNGWGGRLFRFVRPAPDGAHPARDFHLAMAEHWIEQYHVDGFRIDEFKSINNWDFVQQFRQRAWAKHLALFPGRPFIVIAEDSNRRAEVTQDRPGRRKIVDAIWGFAYRDEMRRLLRDGIRTEFGQHSRRDRVQAMISGTAQWEGLDNTLRAGFADLAQVVGYVTSHDMQDDGQARLMNYLFGAMLRERGLGDGSVEDVRGRIAAISGETDDVKRLHADALDRVRSAFALLLTSAAIPMFVAGEEFADVHDLDHRQADLKMSDPVNWGRASIPGHAALRGAVRNLIRLRTSHAALQRNEVEFFYSHPSFDDNEGARVFAYCRTAGRSLGSGGQVVVVANMGGQDFPSFDLPWPWPNAQEHGGPASGAPLRGHAHAASANLSLAPFQARVFSA